MPAPALFCAHAGALFSSQRALEDVAAVCLALAGADTPEDEQAIAASVRPWFPAQCAQQGDEVAQAQVAAAVGDLVTSVVTVAGKLQIQQAFSVVLAGASRIEVHINAQQLAFSVEDDGHGIPAADLSLLGVRHASSKLHSLQQLQQGSATLGFRGEALASIAERARLEITSKACGAFETHCKILQGGTVLKQGLALQPRMHTGTCVTVKDWLFNQPVLRRQVAKQRPQQELENSRQRLLCVALAWPETAFMLVDVNSNKGVLSLSKARTLSAVLPMVFGSLVPDIVEVSAQQGQLHLSGFISRPPAGSSTTTTQLLYVNKRCVTCHEAAKVISALHQSVLQRLGRPHGMAGATLGRAHKDSCGHPAFALALTCPLSCYEVICESNRPHVGFRDTAAVLRLLEAAVLQSWHDLLGDYLITAVQEARAGNPSKAGSSSRHAVSIIKHEPVVGTSDSRDIAITTKRKDEYAVLSQPRRQEEALPTCGAAAAPHGQSAQGVKVFYTMSARQLARKRKRPGPENGRRSAPAAINAESDNPAGDVELEALLQQPLSPLEPQKAASSAPNAVLKRCRAGQLKHHSAIQRPQQGLTSVAELQQCAGLPAVRATLSRAELQQAQLIAQVDSKFLAVVSGGMLALVDQHAADERVQLERLRGQVVAAGGRQGGMTVW
eukprot:jgi/Astpho2/4346/fgenesh1_pg.00065_%23_28_t